MAFETKAEKIAYKKGLFSGLFGRNKKSNKQRTAKSRKTVSNWSSQDLLLEMAEQYRKTGFGSMLYNGKIYDVNYKGKPVEITKTDIANLREEYGMGKSYSDIEVAERYTQHMRRKFGVFDSKTGKWLGLISDVK